MSILNYRTPIILLVSIVITACSPPSGTGVWQSIDESSNKNTMEIKSLIVSFDGRAEFTSLKPNKAVWHCFWSKQSDTDLSLDCTPSTNTDKSSQFILSTNAQDIAHLHQAETILASFKRVDKNPVLPK